MCWVSVGSDHLGSDQSGSDQSGSDPHSEVATGPVMAYTYVP